MGVYFSGKGEIHRMDGKGNILLINEINNLRKGWTQIVPISFGFRTDLFFYDASGKGEICHVDENGNLETVLFHRRLNSGWTHIVPIPVENDFRGPYLLFYKTGPNASGSLIGRAELYRINGLGELNFIDASDKFNPNWADIVAIPAYIPPPVYHIRVQAIVTGEDSQGSFQTNFVQGQFEKQDLVDIIKGANGIYKEAGIHFDFDPNSDIDEIPSYLLNGSSPTVAKGRPLKVEKGINRDYPAEKESQDHYFDPKTGAKLGWTHDKHGIGLYEGEIAYWQLGWRYRGKLVVIFNRDSSYSTGLCEYATRPKCKDIAGDPKDPAAAYINDGRFFAHEVGHYLWLVHTFSWSFNSKAEYETNIRANVERQVTAYADKLGKNASDIIKNGEIPDDILKNGLSIFDADRGLEEDLKIEDTPADPGPWIFENEGMDMCKDPLEISVKFSDKQTQKYVFEVKHRKNVMSYYENNCKLFKFRFSPGQVHVMRSVLGGAKNRQLVPKPEFVWLGMT